MGKLRQCANLGFLFSVPWLYWQVLPNANPNYDWNYEIGGGSYDPSWATLVSASKATYGTYTPFDYSGYLP